MPWLSVGFGIDTPDSTPYGSTLGKHALIDNYNIHMGDFHGVRATYST